MEKAEMTSYLPSSEANEFRRIMISGGDLDERLTATYLRALKPDVFNEMKFRRDPAPPSEWQRALASYRELDIAKRSDGWKELLKRFGGYITSRDEARSQNASDEFFLREMERHFLSKNMSTQAQQVKLRLYSFKQTHEVAL